MRYAAVVGVRLAMLVTVHVMMPASERLVAGLHQRLPCPGTTWSIDMQIPSSAADTPLPVLFLNDPGGNPDVGRWVPWSNTQGFVVAGINDSRNGVNGADLELRQRAAITTAEQAALLHPWFRLSAGFSGGGWASMRMAQTAATAHAGVLVMGHHLNDFSFRPIPTTMPIYFLYGANDTAAVSGMDTIRGTLAKYTTWFTALPGVAHDTPVLEEQQAALAVLIRTIRVTSPRLTEAERTAAWIQLGSEVETLASIGDPAVRSARAAEMLRVPRYEQTRPADYRRLILAWLDARIADALVPTPPAARYLRLDALARDPLTVRIDTARRRPLSDAVAQLQKDPAVRDEMAAAAQLADIQTALGKATGSSTRMKPVIERLRALVAAYPSTAAGLAAAERLRSLAP